VGERNKLYHIIVQVPLDVDFTSFISRCPRINVCVRIPIDPLPEQIVIRRCDNTYGSRYRA
jgi:hypothetical protein